MRPISIACASGCAIVRRDNCKSRSFRGNGLIEEASDYYVREAGLTVALGFIDALDEATRIIASSPAGGFFKRSEIYRRGCATAMSHRRPWPAPETPSTPYARFRRHLSPPSLSQWDYAEAFELLSRMARLFGAAEQSAYVAMLRTRFGRKRNFVKRLS